MFPDVIDMSDMIAFDGTRALTASRLINFDTGTSSLREGHKGWLSGIACPAISSSPNPWIDIYAYASKLGNKDSNLRLSQQRAESTKAFLGQELAKNGTSIEGLVNIEKGFGEDAPGYIAGDSSNEPHWRAVDVIVFGSKPTVIRPPKTPVPPSAEATTFEIRVLGGFSVGVDLLGVPSADNFFFQIVDVARRRTAFYHYTGLSYTFIGLPSPGSVSTAGPPTQFRTSDPVELHQFNAEASLYKDPGGGIGPFSIGGTMRLHLDNMKNYLGQPVTTRPSLIPIEGGSSIDVLSSGGPGKGLFVFQGQVYEFKGY